MSAVRKFRVVAAITSVALITSLTPTSAYGGAQVVGDAGIQSCSEAYVEIWEHSWFNGRGLRICYGSNIPNLATYNFDNITSSATFNELSRNTSVCLYSEIGYIGEIWKATSDQSVQWWGPVPPNDWATSVKFGC